MEIANFSHLLSSTRNDLTLANEQTIPIFSYSPPPIYSLQSKFKSLLYLPHHNIK